MNSQQSIQKWGIQIKDKIQKSEIPYLAVAPVAMGGSTIVESSLQISLFLQNKANLQNTRMNVSSIITRDYEKSQKWTFGENKANQSQYKDISQKMADRRQHRIFFGKVLLFFLRHRAVGVRIDKNWYKQPCMRLNKDKWGN